MSKRLARRKPPTANFHRLKELLRCQIHPPNSPTIAMPTDVSTVHGPGPNGVKKSLIDMDRKPTANPAIGPAVIAAAIVKNAVGFTFGGPPARATLSAAFAAEKQAMNARTFVLLDVAGYMNVPFSLEC